MTTTTFITYSQLMSKANKLASEMYRHRKEKRAWLGRRQAFYDRQGLSFKVEMPSEMSWGNALSQALKSLYREHIVVAQLNEEMRAHNGLIFEWEVGKKERDAQLAASMRQFEMQRLEAGWQNYTGD